MARMTIYVEDDLHAKMKALGDTIKWSQVARDAFMRVVAIRTSGNQTNGSDGVSYGARHLAEGRTLGRAWASQHAEADEVERVAELIHEEFTHAEHAQLLLYRAVFEAEPINWRYGGPFFETFLRERHPIKERVQGFVEGVARFLSKSK